MEHNPDFLPLPFKTTRCFLWQLPKRSEEHTSELQSRPHLVCRLLLEKKKNKFLLDEHKLDTTHQSIDNSDPHVIDYITEAAHSAARHRCARGVLTSSIEPQAVPFVSL